MSNIDVTIASILKKQVADGNVPEVRMYQCMYSYIHYIHITTGGYET